jgi:hypothetical protein
MDLHTSVYIPPKAAHNQTRELTHMDETFFTRTGKRFCVIRAPYWVCADSRILLDSLPCLAQERTRLPDNYLLMNLAKSDLLLAQGDVMVMGIETDGRARAVVAEEIDDIVAGLVK